MTDALFVALYLLAGFGLTILLIFAWLGGSLVVKALSFAVTLAFAEHKWKKLRKASAEARNDLTPTTTDNNDQQDTTKPQGSLSKGG